MKIATIGAGAMAEALSTGWLVAGHDIFVGARSAERATALADRLPGTARAGTLSEAAAFGDVTLLAVPGEVAAEALRAAGAHQGALAGRPLIDCTNALAQDAFEDPPNSFTLGVEAVAESVADVAVGAHVIKAFNMLAAEVWQGDRRTFEGRPLTVPVCGDHLPSLNTVSALATDLGLHPVTAGGLHRARYAEAMTAFIMGLWFSGADVRAMIPPLEAAFAIPD